MDPLVAAGLGLAALAASILGGATGIGAAIALIPAVALTVGVREAVPVVTVAVTMHLFSRIWVNRASIDYSVARWFALGAVPGHRGSLGASIDAHEQLLAQSENFWETSWLRKQVGELRSVVESRREESAG